MSTGGDRAGLPIRVSVSKQCTSASASRSSVGVEQPAERPFERVGLKRRLERVGLEQQRQAGERAFLGRRRGKAQQRRPERVLDLRRDATTFSCSSRPASQSAAQARSPPRRCGAAAGRRQAGSAFAEAPSSWCVAAHGEHRGARRPALVEDEDLRAGIAAELQREQRQQHRLAGAGRADDQHVADVADMGRQPERGRAAGLGEEQGRPVEMRVPSRARPRPPTRASDGRG